MRAGVPAPPRPAGHLAQAADPLCTSIFPSIKQTRSEHRAGVGTESDKPCSFAPSAPSTQGGPGLRESDTETSRTIRTIRNSPFSKHSPLAHSHLPHLSGL